MKTKFNAFTKWLNSWWTMQRKECMFRDQVDGQEVFRYVDAYNQEWMANFNRWGYRVPIKK